MINCVCTRKRENKEDLHYISLYKLIEYIKLKPNTWEKKNILNIIPEQLNFFFSDDSTYAKNSNCFYNNYDKTIYNCINLYHIEQDDQLVLSADDYDQIIRYIQQL